MALRTQVLGDVDDLLYGQLKKQGCLRHPKMPFAIWVRQVQGRRLIDAIFKKRDDKGTGYKFVARAGRPGYISIPKPASFEWTCPTSTRKAKPTRWTAT